MSNVDALVTKDLATAAAANRDRLRSLDDTMHALAPRASVAVPRTTTHGELRVLVFADVYASRVARIAASVAALVSVALVVAASTGWRFDLGWRIGDLFGDATDAATRFAIGILAVYIGAHALARSAFARAVADDPGRAAPMIARLDRWTVALSILGPFVFLMSFGLARVALAGEGLWMLGCSLDAQCRGVGFDTARYVDRLRDLAIAIPLAAIAVGLLVQRLRAHRPGTRPSVLEGGRTIAIGCAIVAATVALGLRFDDPQPTDVHGMDISPDTHLRLALTISGGLGLLVALTALALWRRRREQARLATSSSGS